MEVGGALTGKGAVGGGAVLGSAVALETLLDDGRILAVVVGVHLHVRRADVHLITTILNHPKEKEGKKK